MMDWLATQGNILVLVIFFLMFLGFAVWAYRPKNKDRMQRDSEIPLKESNDEQD